MRFIIASVVVAFFVTAANGVPVSELDSLSMGTRKVEFPSFNNHAAELVERGQTDWKRNPETDVKRGQTDWKRGQTDWRRGQTDWRREVEDEKRGQTDWKREVEEKRGQTDWRRGQTDW
ncbi:hypothetical protein NA57DRAFT_58893 [Rhizodiscina lignyota]|uniref:Uncharacterized protein n=1 Tax=Rhizodiscina lignyota TaxID=1504668 RepID=A0A9P4IC40_9PEZI|nr:hypothetical protein NA57DRAFT_58893 [Rhizodiscina lignyota]